MTEKKKPLLPHFEALRAARQRDLDSEHDKLEVLVHEGIGKRLLDGLFNKKRTD